MLPILQFIFQDLWHFLGCWLLLTIACGTLVRVVAALSPWEAYRYRRDDDDEDGGPLTPRTV